MLHVGDHVRVIDEDAVAVVTAVHPDAQVEVEFLKASEGGSRRRRYAIEALEKVSHSAT
jgi:hypothetical protein